MTLNTDGGVTEYGKFLELRLNKNIYVSKYHEDHINVIIKCWTDFQSDKIDVVFTDSRRFKINVGRRMK